MSQQLTVIGTGVIGNGWIARALARGWDVVAFDPAPGASARTRACSAGFSARTNCFSFRNSENGVRRPWRCGHE